MTPPDRWRRLQERPLVLGHRGARHAEEENTLAAFERARQEGADGVELDVQSSEDGVPFVLHDLDLRRVTDGRDQRPVRTIVSRELDRIELRGGHYPPRLEAVLEWAKQTNMLLNVELKTHAARRDSIAERVADALKRQHGLEPQVLVSSFHPLLLSRFESLQTGMRTGFLFTVQHMAWIDRLWLKRLGVGALHPDARCFLRHGSFPGTNGLLLNTWTVNRPEDARWLASRGVDAIISDCPGRILDSLRNSDA